MKDRFYPLSREKGGLYNEKGALSIFYYYFFWFSDTIFC